ncbi:MAG: exodeoxyribonuclease VII small subunit [Eubacterium sp.]|nr:exodeoxyribonuclease VII small subunit [Eubacterium sp.]MBR6172146.1 exodeoxyribonuclease VII small subunit [Eubacterium sp.]
MPAKKKETNISIEEAFARLEEIIHSLEDPKTSLRDAMTYYEEGVKLLAMSQETLDGVEKELKILKPGEVE